jgi:hypothetical protein
MNGSCSSSGIIELSGLAVKAFSSEIGKRKAETIRAHLSAFLSEAVVNEIINSALQGKEISPERAEELAKKANEHFEELIAADAGSCPTKH